MSDGRARRRAGRLLLAAGLELAAAAALAGDPDERPLTLARAIELGLGQVPELRAAAARLREAEADRRMARDGGRPELWLTTTPGYASGLPGGPSGALPAIASVELRASLYDPDQRARTL